MWRVRKGAAKDADDVGLRACKSCQILNRMCANMHVQKFVRVQNHQPTGGVNRVGLADLEIARMLGNIVRADDVGHMHHHARPVQRIQQFGRAVAAVIRGDIDRIKAKAKVMGDPFKQERPFILYR